MSRARDSACDSTELQVMCSIHRWCVRFALTESWVYNRLTFIQAQVNVVLNIRSAFLSAVSRVSTRSRAQFVDILRLPFHQKWEPVKNKSGPSISRRNGKVRKSIQCEIHAQTSRVLWLNHDARAEKKTECMGSIHCRNLHDRFNTP